MVQCSLLQAEDTDHHAVQDVAGLGEELVEAPALLLVSLQDVGQHRGQEALQSPGKVQTGHRNTALPLFSVLGFLTAKSEGESPRC